MSKLIGLLRELDARRSRKAFELAIKTESYEHAVSIAKNYDINLTSEVIERIKKGMERKYHWLLEKLERDYSLRIKELNELGGRLK